MKKTSWIIIGIVFVVIIIITAEIIFYINSPKCAVIKTFNSLKKGDVITASQFIDYNELMKYLNSEFKSDLTTMSENEAKCFNKLSFKIVNEEIQDDKATITISSTNKNFRTVLDKLIKEIYLKQSSGEEINKEQMIEKFYSFLDDEKIGTITTTRDISLEKVDKKWKIIVDSNVEDAIFPGLADLVKSVDMLLASD